MNLPFSYSPLRSLKATLERIKATSIPPIFALFFVWSVLVYNLHWWNSVNSPPSTAITTASSYSKYFIRSSSHQLNKPVTGLSSSPPQNYGTQSDYLPTILRLKYGQNPEVSANLDPTLMQPTLQYDENIGESGDDISYDIDLPHCKIPRLLEAENESILWDYSRVRDASGGPWGAKLHRDCPGKLPDLTYMSGSKIYLNVTVLGFFYPKTVYSQCQLSQITRDLSKPSKADNKILYIRIPPEEGGTFKWHSDPLTQFEFVEVACYDKNGFLFYVNIHANDAYLPEEERPDYRPSVNDVVKLSLEAEKINIRKRKRVEKSPNVLMIGIDSTSRLNFIRGMAKTRQFLEARHAANKSGPALTYKGYVKLGENTFPNLVPLLLGQMVTDFPNRFRGKNYDDYFFIWHDYRANHYRTIFAEDSPEVGTFTYHKLGFKAPPTTFYFRPMALALRKLNQDAKHAMNCVSREAEVKAMFKYTLNSIRSIQRINFPFFALAYTTKLTHSTLFNVKRVDEMITEFLTDLQRTKLLDNTFVILFGDHGLRYGTYRRTFYGMMEERLPLLHIVVPKKFETYYPKFMANMRANTQVLTTPLDVYETLTDIVSLTYTPTQKTSRKKSLGAGEPGDSKLSHDQPMFANQKSYSLFTRIPNKRTCQEAGISPTICPCNSIGNDFLMNEREFLHGAKLIINQINNVLLKNHRHLCHIYIFERIQSVRLFASDPYLVKYFLGMSKAHAKNAPPPFNSEEALSHVDNRTVTPQYSINLSKVNPKIKSRLRVFLSIKVRPKDAVFEALLVAFRVYKNIYVLGYNETSGSFDNVIGEISRLNKYGNKGFCIKDSPDLQKYCFCK